MTQNYIGGKDFAYVLAAWLVEHPDGLNKLRAVLEKLSPVYLWDNHDAEKLSEFIFQELFK